MNVANTLDQMSQSLAVCAGDPKKPVTNEYDARLYRLSLILEEACELTQGMVLRNEEHVLDALADLKYVTEGTAVTYRLPLPEAFEEVHRSNMTKTDEALNRADSDSDKGKTEAYSPPEIRKIIKKYRKYY